MYSLFKNAIICFCIIFCVTSCQIERNENQIQLIYELEKVTISDKGKLQSLDIKKLESYTKIAKFNLLQLENKKLDSINIQLMYFEYIEYLQAVNQIVLTVEKIEALQQALALNEKQVNNIKKDYLGSSKRRVDLDQYLENEKNIIDATSKEVTKIYKIAVNLNEQFDTLNKNIELIINEN